MEHKYKALVAKEPKEPMVLESVEVEPLGAEDVEVAVDHRGLCHSDLSVLNDDWGISRFPATLGHEVVGRIHCRRFSREGFKGRAARRCGLDFRKLHALSQVHVRKPSRLSRSAGDYRRTSRRFRDPYPLSLGLAIPLPEQLNVAEAGPLLCGGITVFAPLAMMPQHLLHLRQLHPTFQKF
jgi:uncharacterized zinc-type alcohol dehydrogenase-like protein